MKKNNIMEYRSRGTNFNVKYTNDNLILLSKVSGVDFNAELLLALMVKHFDCLVTGELGNVIIINHEYNVSLILNKAVKMGMYIFEFINAIPLKNIIVSKWLDQENMESIFVNKLKAHKYIGDDKEYFDSDFSTDKESKKCKSNVINLSSV